MRGIVLGGAVLFALSTMGCKRIIKEVIREVAKESSSSSEEGEDVADLTGPTKVVDVEWLEPNKFQLPGEPEKYGTVSVFEGNYQITLHGLPVGSEFTVGETTTKIDSSVYNIIKLKDMKPEFGKLKIEDLRSVTLDPGLTGELRVPGKRSTFKLPPARVLSLDKILEKVENTPVLFEGEPEKEGEGFAVLSMMNVTPEVFGKATYLQDVDAIAMTRRLEAVKGKKVCTGYKDRDKKPKPDVTLLLKETEAIIYDRRTSDVVDKKVFAPDNDCPMFTIGDDTETNSSTPRREIEEWIRGHVKR